MRVFVAGATGAIGRPLTRQLREAGHEVIGMTRSEERAAALREAGAEAVIADALDTGAVRNAVEGARPDVVVNELTDLARRLNPRKYAEWLEGTNRLRTQGTRNLVEAADAIGVKRVVSQSCAFAYSFEPGTKTEDDALQGSDGGEMWAAVDELELLTLGAPGGIVLRYGFFYGPGTAYDRDGQQIELIRKRQMPVIAGGKGAFPFIHVEDAASATVAAIERGGPGVYNVVDDDPAYVRDWIPYLAQVTGSKKPMRVPGFIARIAAGSLAAMAGQMQPVSNAKARTDLGWEPRYPSWREGFRAELGQPAGSGR
jgi:nucleoside-diphosphate-sugar epimerase